MYVVGWGWLLMGVGLLVDELLSFLRDNML
jgi:hypothetical protein